MNPVSMELKKIRDKQKLFNQLVHYYSFRFPFGIDKTPIDCNYYADKEKFCGQAKEIVHAFYKNAEDCYKIKKSRNITNETPLISELTINIALPSSKIIINNAKIKEFEVNLDNAINTIIEKIGNPEILHLCIHLNKPGTHCHLIISNLSEDGNFISEKFTPKIIKILNEAASKTFFSDLSDFNKIHNKKTDYIKNKIHLIQAKINEYYGEIEKLNKIKIELQTDLEKIE